jgi:hypothetical protein
MASIRFRIFGSVLMFWVIVGLAMAQLGSGLI